MSIKRALIKAAEKFTGRNCGSCRYNRGGRCAHPKEAMFLKCWNSLTKPGHTGKFERTVFTLRVTEAQWVPLRATALSRQCGVATKLVKTR